jgi:hypothetical protein
MTSLLVTKRTQVVLDRLGAGERLCIAQACAEGKSQAEAYRLAGFTGGRQAASKVRHRVDVSLRVAELQGRALKVVERVEAKAFERTIEKGVASREQVLAQWARIAFFDR